MLQSINENAKACPERGLIWGSCILACIYNIKATKKEVGAHVISLNRRCITTEMMVLKLLWTYAICNGPDQKYDAGSYTPHTQIPPPRPVSRKSSRTRPSAPRTRDLGSPHTSTPRDDDDLDDEAAAADDGGEPSASSSETARLDAVLRRLTVDEVRIRVHQVSIRGCSCTRRAAVEAAVGPDVARAATMRDLVRAAAAAGDRLRRLGAFDTVSITLDAAPPGIPGSVVVVVVVDVAEARGRAAGEFGVFAHTETRSCSLEGSVKLKNLFGYCETWDASEKSIDALQMELAAKRTSNELHGESTSGIRIQWRS